MPTVFEITVYEAEPVPVARCVPNGESTAQLSLPLAHDADTTEFAGYVTGLGDMLIDVVPLGACHAPEVIVGMIPLVG